MSFLHLWREYVHLIDDIVDEDLAGRSQEPGVRSQNGDRARGIERINRMGAMAVMLYTHPFFLKNAGALRQVVLNCTNAYADSALWEHSEVDWQRQWADHYRHFGAEMVLAVASSCGGYEHMRSFSPELRCICWHEHHTPTGEPT